MLPVELAAFASTNLCNDCGNVSTKGKQAAQGEEGTVVEDFKCSVRVLVCFSVTLWMRVVALSIFKSNNSDGSINTFLSVYVIIEDEHIT